MFIINHRLSLNKLSLQLKNNSISVCFHSECSLVTFVIAIHVVQMNYTQHLEAGRSAAQYIIQRWPKMFPDRKTDPVSCNTVKPVYSDHLWATIKWSNREGVSL